MASSSKYGESGAERMFDNLLRFLRASDWAASKRVLERHPELMNDAGYFMIDMIADDPVTATNVFPMLNKEEALEMVDRHRVILARCRQVGVGRAFQDLT